MSQSQVLMATLLFGLVLSAAAADQTQKAYHEVNAKVRDRSGQTLRWEKDQATRQQNLDEARRLLRQPLSVRTAVAIALLNNRRLQATLEDVGIALADFRQAGYLTNPTLSVNPQFPDHGPRSPEWDYGLSTSLLDALFIPLRKTLAAEALEAAKLQVAAEALQLVSDVKSACYELVAGLQTMDRLQAVAEVFDAALVLAQKQFEAGNITDVNLGLQQIEYSQTRLELAELDAKQREDHEKLNRLMGLYGLDTVWTAERTLPRPPDKDPPFEGLETLAVTQRYDLAARRRDLQATLQRYGILRRYGFLTAIDAGVAGQRNRDGSNQVGPSLSLQVPLFDQGQARTARGATRLRQAQRNFEDLAIEVRSEVRELRDRLDARRRTVAFYETDLLPFRHRLVNAQRLQYNAMVLSPYELFRTRVEELQAERNYLTALKEYWQARAELERAVGGSFNPAPPTSGKPVLGRK
jgi:outer membrane protein, heavy metal efflux system